MGVLTFCSVVSADSKVLGILQTVDLAQKLRRKSNLTWGAP